MLKRIIHISVIILSTCILYSQENHFSQFYSSPQYLNPAFAGDASHIKTGASSRIMQPVSGEYVINSLLHYSHKIKDQRNGFGFTFYNHTEEMAHTKFQVNFSHTIRLNKTQWIKAGLGVSVNQRKNSPNSYLYPDQYGNLGLNGNATQEPSLNDNSIFPGITAGLVYYNNLFWVSFSGDYLNKPQENFAGSETIYPARFSLLSGLLIPLNKTTSKRRFSKFGGLAPYSSIGPIFCLTKQDRYFESSLGVAVHLKPVFGGIHYRYQQDFNQSESDRAYKGLVMMAGFRQEEFSFTYSYDYSLSSYGVNRSGAHEISLIFYFSSWKEDKRHVNLVPLPNQLLY